MLCIIDNKIRWCMICVVFLDKIVNLNLQRQQRKKPSPLCQINKLTAVYHLA